jgi:hypothetical protein
LQRARVSRARNRSRVILGIISTSRICIGRAPQNL